MLSAEDSLAKTSQQQEKEPESQENEADSGERWPESLAKYDPNTHSWRTHQCSLFGVGYELLQTLPKWGMTVGGECLPLWNVERCTYESDFSWLPIPTPNATDGKGGCNKPRNDNGKLRLDQMRHWWKILTDIHAPDPNFTEGIMLFPIMWTDLNPLATDKFRLWLQAHSAFLAREDEMT